MQAPAFENEAVAGAVLELGKELVRALNGFYRLSRHESLGMTCNGVSEFHSCGKQTAYLSGHAKMVVGSFGELTVENRNGEEVIPPKPRAHSIAELSFSDPKVTQVLRFMGTLSGDPLNDWSLLAKIHEVIEADSCTDKSWWGSGKKHKSFTATANNAQVIGDASRHAVSRFQTPAKVMSFDEADDFINQLVNSWLSWKISQVSI